MGANAPLVLVTQTAYAKGLAVFEAAEGLRCVRAPSAERELAAAVRAQGARHVILGVTRYEGPLYEALPPGGVLARFGVGHDGIDKEKATAARLLATNTPGVLDRSVAEHTLLLMLAVARHLEAAAADVRQGRWGTPAGQELAGKGLAVIGCGPIGRAVARCAAFGFGMYVSGCDPVVAFDAAMRDQWGFANIVTDFGAAVRGADFVSLHIPVLPSTIRFLGAERLALLGPRTWVINTARGAVVDEDALYDALAAGRIAGAALDVFEHEPYRPGDPARDLRQLPNALLTPHIGSNTAEANRRMAERALHNIALAEAGKWSEMDLLNPQVLDRIPGARS
jgi:phosphoglycerate dehydrogenase-like enzyme